MGNKRYQYDDLLSDPRFSAWERFVVILVAISACLGAAWGITALLDLLGVGR